MAYYFSTRSVHRADRRAAWQTNLAARCSIFDIDVMAAHFDASIELRDIGSLRCSRVMQTAVKASRSQREIRARAISEHLLIVQIAGQSHMEQAGRVCALQQGDITLIDPMQPSYFSFDEKSIQLSLHIPTERLGGTDELPHRLAIRLPGSTSRLVGPLIRSAFDQAEFSRTRHEAISDAIIGLIDAGLHLEDDGDIDRTPERLKSVQRYILDHLGEELTPALIARANAISERALHRMFGGHGFTVGSWIKEKRLDYCAADLLDRGLADSTVTNIAFKWGFNNMSHFSRSFQAYLGVTPTAYRTAKGGTG